MIRHLFTVLDEPGRVLLRRMLTGLVVSAVLQGVAFALLVPLLRALLGPSPADAWPWLGVLALTFAGYAVAHWDSQMAGCTVGSGLSRLLHHRLGDHVATLPLGWFTTEHTGRLASKNVIDIMGVPAHLLRPIITA